MKKTNIWPGVIIIGLIVTGLIGLSSTFTVAEQKVQVVKMTAKKFEYSPKEITLKKGVPTVLEITALDRVHGFDCPDLKIRETLMQGKVTKVSFTPQKAGTFPFHCDIFCGDGHEDMTGTIIVTE